MHAGTHLPLGSISKEFWGILINQRMAEAAVVRFRVTDVFRDACVRLSLDGRELARRKKRVLAPGEMEQMTVTRSDLAEARADSVLTVELEA